MRILKKLVSSFLCFFSFGLIFAQTNIERAVKIKSADSDAKALRVYEVERKTETVGNYFSTTIEYMIENRTDRILEGEFEFPLQEGENIGGYALDIDGKMRDAVVVEKEKGRQVFEEIVRRGVDPGLVEKTEGNNFKTRVYPIPARGVRHLQVTVEKELSSASDSGKVFVQTIGKDTYFYFYEALENAQKSVVEPVETKSLTIAFDISGSGKNRDVKKEIDFLKKYIQSAFGSKLPEMNIVTFSNAVNEVKNFSANGNFSEIEKFLENQKFDGATNFTSLFETLKSNKNLESSQILLFSDGIENWNGRFEKTDVSGLVVHTINSSFSGNFANLKKIANAFNGNFINLSEMKTEEAVLKIRENPLRIMNVEFDRNAISEVYPSEGSVSGDFSLAGILKRKSGTVKITLGRNGKVEKVIEKQVSSINNDSESEKVSRLWAMKKLSALEIDYDSNRNEIMELAKKFSIVTNDTSLIVLENISDYVRYGIVPPEELRAEYDRLVSRQTQVKRNDDSIIPEIVYRKFEEFKKWWNKTPKEFAEESKKDQKPIARQFNSRNSVMQEMAVTTDAVAAPMVVEERMMMSAAPMAKAAGAPKLAKSAGNSAGSENGNGSKISLQAWNSKSDYISILKKTENSKMYEKYLELKKSYENSPAFYMEVSDYFAEEGLKSESLRILSNLAELNLENTDVLRALGNKLVERDEFGLAVFVFEKLTKIRSEVPQFYRDLGLAYNLAGEKQKAIDSLWKVASKNWDSRYSEIQQTALNDMNAIIADTKLNQLNLSKIDSKLMENFDVDVRIVLTWNTDDCDVDLWVTDPNGEKCFYGHKQTALGGRMSRDFTQGYGPEEFCLKSAPKGKYKIEANYFGNRQQKVLQPVILQAEVYTNFGRENQKREVLTLQLDDVKQTFLIGEIEFSH